MRIGGTHIPVLVRCSMLDNRCYVNFYPIRRLGEGAFVWSST